MLWREVRDRVMRGSESWQYPASSPPGTLWLRQKWKHINEDCSLMQIIRQGHAQLWPQMAQEVTHPLEDNKEGPREPPLFLKCICVAPSNRNIACITCQHPIPHPYRKKSLLKNDLCLHIEYTSLISGLMLSNVHYLMLDLSGQSRRKLYKCLITLLCTWN